MNDVFVRDSLRCVASLVFFCPLIYADVPQKVEEYGVKDLEGVVVGIGLGYSHLHLSNEQYAQKSTFANRSLLNNTSLLIEQKRCVTDVLVGVGYSHFFKNWYFGISGEISFGKNNKKSVIFDGFFPTESKISGFSFSSKLKGGYYFKGLNVLVCGIAGLRWQNVEIQYNFDDGIISSVGSKAKLSMPLYTVGIGIERPIYKKLSFSTEYEYIWRNSKDISTVSAGTMPTRFYVKQRLRAHNFKIGIKYHL